MKLTELELMILKKISENHLMTKSEIRDFLKGKIKGSTSDIVDSSTKGLAKKGLIQMVNPIGSTCIVITQTGNKMISEME